LTDVSKNIRPENVSRNVSKCFSFRFTQLSDQRMDANPYNLLADVSACALPSAVHGVQGFAHLDTPEITQARDSLRAFVCAAWHVLEPMNSFVPGFHLDAICDHLQAITKRQIRHLLINVPPRHMKSLAVGVFWPAWEWIANPHRRWLFASYAMSLSERDSNKCRSLIVSPWYQKHFGDSFQLSTDQNTKLRFENDKSGHRIATSVGGSATGEGGDRVVVDDPHNVIDRESDAERARTLIWWDETMSTRLNDPKKGSKVIVMQRIHEKDLSGHVLEQGGYTHLRLPAEFELSRRCVVRLPDFGWKDPREADGALLWQARFGKEELAELKVALGPEGYAGQFQQRPAPMGGARFRGEWFRYYVRTEDGGTERTEDGGLRTESKAHPHLLSPQSSALSPPYVLLTAHGADRVISSENCHRFAVMDPAGTEAGESRRACYTVIQVWDVTPTGDMLLVHQYRKQVQAPDAAAAAVRISNEFDVAYIAIEKDGMGLGVVQHVKREGIAVRPIKARGSKESRSQTAEIRMAAGQIYFPRGAPFLFELEKELLSFPKSQYLDQVDALSHAAIEVSRICRGRNGGVEEDEEVERARDEERVWELV
jgi:predicted phage terminase large subunit-like protein